MSKVIRLIRKDDKVLDADTGLEVGTIQDGGIKFTSNLEGHITYDKELEMFLREERVREDDKYISGTIEAELDNYLSTEEEIDEREAERTHEEREY